MQLEFLVQYNSGAVQIRCVTRVVRESVEDR
jgi:hypothetical protein